MLWNKASLVSVDKIDQFYVSELEPFVRAPPVGRQPDSLQQYNVTEVRDQSDANNITLYGSTQLAVDLAELAAEAGNETLAVGVGNTACTQMQASGTELTATAQHSEETTRPADAPIALDGFCLQSSSVCFMPFRVHAAGAVQMSGLFTTECWTLFLV